MSKPIKETDLIMRPDGGAFHIGLTASQVPERIIAVGDPDRVEMVSRYFDTIDFKVQKREFVSHGGTYKGKDVLAISTGIGMDNVEIVMTELDALVNVDLETRLAKSNPTRLSIVRVGTSGSMQADIPAGSELVSTTAVGFDNLMSFYSLKQTAFEDEVTLGIQRATELTFQPYMADCSTALLGKVGFDIVRGNTATCPGFYAPQGRQVRLGIQYPELLNHLSEYNNGRFRLTNFEMETASYYAFGRMLGHDMLSLNAILINRVTNETATNSEVLVDGLIKKVLERV
jgi:uridine phosphorylase